MLEGAIVDRSLLEQAGVVKNYDLWAGIAGAAGWVTGVATLFAALGGIALLLANQQTAAFVTAAETFGKNLDAKTRQGPVSSWPTRLLREDKWVEAPAPSGLTRWTKPRTAAQGSDVPPPTEMLIMTGEETLAHILASPFGDKFAWPYGPIADRLKDGARDVRLVEAVRRLGIADFIRTSNAPVVQVIGVGLESSHGGDPKDHTRALSWGRGVALAVAASQSIVSIDPTRIQYRGLGLGRAIKQESRETAAERRQRSALIMTVAFHRYDAAVLSLEDSIWQAIVEVPLSDLDLLGYEYAYDDLPPVFRTKSCLRDGLLGRGSHAQGAVYG